MRRYRWIVACGWPLTIALASAPALAEPPCAADVRKLCPDEPAGGRRIQACFERHEGELSEACRKRVDGLVEEIGAVGATCRNDVVRFCSDVSPGGGRLVGCLTRHADEISPECSDILKQRP